jgi:hypothetical protein
MNDAEYYSTLMKALRMFRQPGDHLRCVKVFPEEGSACQLCGKVPIKWVYVLKNARTDECRQVGSECIKNYQLAAQLIDDQLPDCPQEAQLIVFDRACKKAWQWIEQRRPGMVLLEGGPDIEHSIPGTSEDDYEWDEYESDDDEWDDDEEREWDDDIEREWDDDEEADMDEGAPWGMGLDDLTEDGEPVDDDEDDLDYDDEDEEEALMREEEEEDEEDEWLEEHDGDLDDEDEDDWGDDEEDDWDDEDEDWDD